MRLRYLHLPDYGPLKNVEVVFGRNSFLQRPGEINFVVGLNGSGKSSLLRAVYDVFHSLCREELPKFPVTLAYDIYKGQDSTVVFHRPRGPASKCFLVPAAGCLDFTRPDEWQNYVLNGLAPEGNADSLGYYVAGDQLKGNGNLRNWLPSRVVAYTSGDLNLWQEVAYPAFPNDELRDDPQDFVREAERPRGWTSEQEHYDVRVPSVGDSAIDRPFRSKSSNPDDMDDRCILLTPDDIHLAAVSIGIWQAAQEREAKVEEYQQEAFQQLLEKEIENQETGEGGRRLLNGLDWLWPTHAAFRFATYGNHMAFSDAARCFWLHALADAVVRHPLEEWQAVVSLGPRPPINPVDLVGGDVLGDPLPMVAEPMRGAEDGR